MTLRASLARSPAGDPFAPVAGMSVLLRQLLSLQDAGIGEVIVPAALLGLLPVDPRLTVPLVSAQPGDAPPDAALHAAAGLVWHRGLPGRLLEQGYRGDIATAPLEPAEFIVTVTDRESALRAEDLLLQSLIKPSDGIISRAFNRPISLRITRTLLDSSLTPNQMTLIAGLFGLAAIVVVAVGGVRWLIAGAVLLQIQSILDGCDGEISRLKYIRSRLGEWLDQVLDDLVNLGFFVAAGWALHQAGSPVAGPVTLVGTVLHLIYQLALYAGLWLRGGGSGSITSIRWWGQRDQLTPPSISDRTAGLVTRIKQTIEIAGRRDFFIFLYLPAAILRVTEIALIWSAIIFAVSGLTTGLMWLLRGGPEPALPAARSAGGAGESGRG